MSMIERLLFKVMEDGIAELQAKPALLEDFFLRGQRLAPEEVAEILIYFKDTPPTVRHQYAREGDPIPSYNIILGTESESDRFLGDDIGIGGELLGVDEDDDPNDFPQIDQTDPNAGADLSGAIWTSEYMILTYTDNPDVTAYYYQISKYILTRARSFLKGEGLLLDTQLSGGDLAPDPRYIPEHLFVRQLVFEAAKVECVADAASPDRFTRIRGIHVNDGVPAEQKGGVVSKVTPFIPSEEE